MITSARDKRNPPTGFHAHYVGSLVDDLDRTYLATSQVVGLVGRVHSISQWIGWELKPTEMKRMGVEVVGVAALFGSFLRWCLELAKAHEEASLIIRTLETAPFGRDLSHLFQRHVSHHHEAILLAAPWVQPVALPRLRKEIDQAIRDGKEPRDLDEGSRLARYWRGVRGHAIPKLKDLGAALALEYRSAREVLVQRDGIWLRWKNLPDAWRRIYASLDDGRATAEVLSRRLQQSNHSVYRETLSMMKQIGILRTEGKKGYVQCAGFIRPRKGQSAG